MTILFVQARAHRAGAQVSLHRLLSSGALRSLPVAVACGAEGWLTEALRAIDVPTHVLRFPRSRSVTSRVTHNRAFGRDVLARVPQVSLVVANDHGEGRLARAVSRLSGAPWVAILRSSETTARDLDKYAISEARVVFAVGGRLRSRAAGILGVEAEAYPEGLLDADFAPAAPAPTLPDAALVVGTAHPDKGWGDLQAALTTDVARPTRWCFTADEVPLSAPRGHRFEAIGRSDDYVGLVRRFGLVVHPSHAETFGLAVAEAVAAGVPVLTSETGVVPALGLPAGLTFPPGDVAALRARLEGLAAAWPPDLTGPQGELRARFRLPALAAPFAAHLARLSSGARGG